MTGPPVKTPDSTAPGGFQARADGQTVEVRTYEGELVRLVPPDLAKDLLDTGLAERSRHCVRLKLGICWMPPRLDRPSGRPDLNQMRRREPDRYTAIWRGSLEPHVGKGALGRSVMDATVQCRRYRDGG